MQLKVYRSSVVTERGEPVECRLMRTTSVRDRRRARTLAGEEGNVPGERGRYGTYTDK